MKSLLRPAAALFAGIFLSVAPSFLVAAEAPASPRQQARALDAREFAVGTLIPDVDFTDLKGKAWRLSSFQHTRPAVIALVSTSCPVSKRYLPTLAKLEVECREKGAALLLVAPTATDKPDDLRAAFRQAGLTAPCAADSSGALAAALHASSTTDAFVLDGARTLAYRGAVDDQYGLGYSLDAPHKRYLSDALAAVSIGDLPEIRATEAPGCALDIAAAKSAGGAPGYHDRIARLVQTNCQECHHNGGIAPFALETYEQVSAKAGMIRKMVSGDLMPPWFAAPGQLGKHIWANDRSLLPQDKADLLAWIADGKPEGAVADAPLPRHWPADWAIGAPDAVIQIPQPIEVKATGTMPYQNVTVDTEFGEDKWVQSFEIRPTAREVVHHVLVMVENPGSKRGQQDGLISGFFAAYVPGNNVVRYPEGLAKLLPAGAKLHFQIHYTPNGTATQDQVRLGLVFAKAPPEHMVRVAGIANVFLKIPPGDDNFPVTGMIPVIRPVQVLAFMPHMHLRGKAFRFEATLPDGTRQTLLDVPRYDFNWQLSYRYAEPMALPRGSKVEATGWFDNSANNPANPDPAKLVKWGPQTSDEMMIGYVEYYFTDESPRANVSVR